MPSKIRPSGGYRQLSSFQTATIIYDATYWFCEQHLAPRSRMADQMVQAARSGRQNIAEGSRASATSTQTELRLMNVARSSLDELLLDYEDYLRHRRKPMWSSESPEALAVRRVAQQFGRSQSNDPGQATLTDTERAAFYAPWLENEDPAIRANALICLINQANYLLDRQIAELEQAFILDGGYSEQLAGARMAERARKRAENPPDQTNQSDQTDHIPHCPQCGRLMALRTAKSGPNTGNSFWGCTGYPECKGTVKL